MDSRRDFLIAEMIEVVGSEEVMSKGAGRLPKIERLKELVTIMEAVDRIVYQVQIETFAGTGSVIELDPPELL
jgi:hypothetical protein